MRRMAARMTGEAWAALECLHRAWKLVLSVAGSPQVLLHLLTPA